MSSLPSPSAILHSAKKNRWDTVINAFFHLETQSAKEDHATNDTSIEVGTATSIIRQLSFECDVRTGNTIGHFAATANRVDVLECLFRMGIDLKKSNFSNRSPMQEARNKENDEALDFILNNVYSPVERLFYGDDTYDCMIKVFTKCPEAINDALECYNNMTWACLCVEEARLRELKWLYEHGANFQITDECGNTLLHMMPIPLSGESEESDSELSDDSWSRRRSSGSSRTSGEFKSSSRRRGRKPSEILDGSAGPHEITSQNLGDQKPVHSSDKNSTENKQSFIECEKSTKKEIEILSDHKKLDSVNDEQLNKDDRMSESCHITTTNGPKEEAPEDEVLGILGPLEDFSCEEVNALRVLAYLLSIRQININQANSAGSTPAHVIAERGACNPTVAWRALRLLGHCSADFNIQDNEGLNVAMVLAGSCGDGPWLTWCLRDCETGGGGCDPNVTDVKGRRVEDHIVTANLETFDDELDIDEEESEEPSSGEETAF